ncbi:S24 family peptidase [Legionella israelensis]|uniref:S24 family peptidase n=1 Tax=Legionella israelensis TaxID=454 RepID=UPI003CC914BE
MDGELTVKRLFKKEGRFKAENSSYPPIDITEEQDMVIWSMAKRSIPYPVSP